MKRFLATLMVVAMMISTMVVGTVPAAAAETDDAASQYVTLDGDWHFKLYRTYSNMFQYIPYAAYGWFTTTWEDMDAARFPADKSWETWETVTIPTDDPETGGLLGTLRPGVEVENESDATLEQKLFPSWSEAWLVKEFDLPADFTEDDTVTLLMGIIDDNDVIYINGQAVAASGFVDGNGNALSDVAETGGFNYTAADKAEQIKWAKSYWEIQREYVIPADVLNLGGKNEIAIRAYNNNGFGGLYNGHVYALCGNELAVRNLKGLPIEKAESAEVMAAVEAQIAAVEAGDIDAFAATIAENYHNDADTKAERVAAVAAELEKIAEYTVNVEDTDAVIYKDEDGNYWYSAKRTFYIGEEYSEVRQIELCYKVSAGQAQEIGNWNRCYATGYASELFGSDLTYSVYLPPSYYTDATKEYPVVWLLHGRASSSTSYRNVDHIGEFMDDQIASGNIMEMVLIMPDSGKYAFYRDSELSGTDKDNTGPWATQLTEELRGVAQETYRIKTEAEYNGLTGNSMGGYGSMVIGTSNPDLYSSIAVHMGHLPADALASLEALNDAQGLDGYDFYLDAGLQDATVGYEGTVAVHEYLESVDKDHVYSLRDGGHNSAFYMEGMVASMKMHSDHFRKNMTMEEASKYVTLDGDWHFKLYRTYSNMFQYIPYAAYGWFATTWEDMDAASFPADKSWEAWETVTIPTDDPETGGLLGTLRPGVEVENESDATLEQKLFPSWSEAWLVKEFDLPADFTEDDTVTLLMGIIDDNDVIYINGQAVAASGFVDGNGNALSDVAETGGFNYTAADKAEQIKWAKSYWEIQREYVIPADVLNLGGKNEIAIRAYNNNGFGGLYNGHVYALCGNELAVRYLKELPIDRAQSDAVDAVIEAQIGALESGNISAYAETIANDYHNDADVKADKVAKYESIIAAGDISVEDADPAVYIDENGYYWYAADRTVYSGGEVVHAEVIEQCYKIVGGKAVEYGNWNRCYGTNYASELFGQNLTYSVYLPPSYYTSTKEYPVVWLLHGRASSSTSYRNVDRIGEFMDAQIEAGNIEEMVLIMPDSGKYAFYRDSELSGTDKDNTGPWATQLTKELRGVAQQTYRIKKEARFNGLTGNSMGGYGSMVIGTSNPDLYSSIAVHMGHLPADALDSLKALSDNYGLTYYDFYLDAGLQDATVGYEGTVAVHEYLESVGKEHVYSLRDGGHNSAFYMEGMVASMKMHSDHFVANGLYQTSGGGGGGSVSSTTSTTTKNEDGSTTTVTTDKKTGEVAQTNKTVDGVTGTVVTDKDGIVTEVSAKIPAAAAQEAAKNEEIVTVPVQVSAAPAEEAVEVKVDVPSNTDKVVVEIPVNNVSAGTVVVVVDADGNESVVKTAGVSENGVVVALEEDVTIKVVDAAKDFVDVDEDDWFSDAADFTSARGLMDGVSEDEFGYEISTTRSMVAQILYSMENNPDVENADVFNDVQEDQWYADAAAWAAESGVVSGYPNGDFGPDDKVTREQLAVMLWSYAGKQSSNYDIDSFKDAADVSSYADTAIRWAVENGLLSGKGNGMLDPKGTASRAEVAAVLMSYYSNVMY